MKLSILKKLNKASYKYLVLCIISLGICIYYIINNIQFFNPKIILPIKSFIHKCINLPSNIKEIINVHEENTRLKNNIATIEKKLKLIEQQHSICNKLNQNIKKFNALDANNIEQVLGYEQGVFDSSLIISLSNTKEDKTGYIVLADGLAGVIASTANDIGLVHTITDSTLYVPVKTLLNNLSNP